MKRARLFFLPLLLALVFDSACVGPGVSAERAGTLLSGIDDFLQQSGALYVKKFTMYAARHAGETVVIENEIYDDEAHYLYAASYSDFGVKPVNGDPGTIETLRETWRYQKDDKLIEAVHVGYLDNHATKRYSETDFDEAAWNDFRRGRMESLRLEALQGVDVGRKIIDYGEEGAAPEEPPSFYKKTTFASRNDESVHCEGMAELGGAGKISLNAVTIQNYFLVYLYQKRDELVYSERSYTFNKAILTRPDLGAFERIEII